MSFTAIDLSTLTPPDIVEAVDYQTILTEMVADLRARDATFTALVESDPAFKILEVAAYREMLIRQRVNDAARGVMVATATGADLDNLGAVFGVQRKTITPADPNTIPPTPAVMETDSDYRRRVQLALEGMSTAGPKGGYIFHALQVTGVKDASALGPEDGQDPGDVLVTVLGQTGNGVPSSAIVTAVTAQLNDDDVRPLTDNVTVQAASVTSYAITATIYTYAGPDPAVLIDQAEDNAAAFTADNHKLGRDIRRSAIFAALHVPGVQRVELTSPAADIVLSPTQAGFCTAINISHGGVDE
jgi:phage-related baseplate assembly protein